MSSTVRIGEETHAALKELARVSGRSMQEILANAVEAYRRRLLLDRTNAAYAALRSDPKRWGEILGERAEWDASLGDGLDAS